MRASSDGKYLSVTATVNATSREQLDDLYRELVVAPDGDDGAVDRRARRVAPRRRGRFDARELVSASEDYLAVYVSLQKQSP